MQGKLLAQEKAVITGVASGIGRGIAIALAREGASVALTDIDADRGEEIATALREEGCDASFITADLATDNGAERLLKGGLDKFGTPSISYMPRVPGAWRLTTSSTSAPTPGIECFR